MRLQPGWGILVFFMMLTVSWQSPFAPSKQSFTSASTMKFMSSLRIKYLEKPKEVAQNTTNNLTEKPQIQVEISSHIPMSQTFFTFTPLLISSVLLQTLKHSGYYPSAQNPVVSTLSPTRLQLPGTISLLRCVILPPSLLSNLH